MPRDGEEKRIEASLVYVWQEGDSSVGINDGWIFLGVEVGDPGPMRLLEVEQKVLPVRAGETQADRVTYVFDEAATREIESYCQYEPDDEGKQLMESIFPKWYLPDERDYAIFGGHYTPPEKFSHGGWHMVARLEKTPPEGDGQDVEIDESRYPARFFRLRVLPGVNSIGAAKSALTLTTESGDKMGRLVLQIGQAFAEGMLGFHPEEEV